MDIDEVLASIDATLKRRDRGEGRHHTPTGSRFAGPAASAGVLDRLAAGGTVEGEASVAVRQGGERAGKAGGFATAMTKALAEATGVSGGVLLPIEVSADVAALIRARVAVMQLGPTVVPVRKELDLPAVATGATAYYVAENAAIPTSEETFGIAVALRPKALAALVPISNRLLRDAAENPSIEQVVQRDLAEVLALRQDLAFLQGQGTSEPLGIVNTPNLTPAPSLGASGRTPTYDDLYDTVAALRAVNAPFVQPGWLFHPRTLNTLSKLKDAQGRYLADTGRLAFDGTGAGGTLLGFPFRTTTQVPTNLTVGSSTDTSYIVFSSDWQEAYVGENQWLTIEASGEAPYTPDGGTTWVSAYQNMQTVLRATIWHDFALRRPALWTVLQGVRP